MAEKVQKDDVPLTGFGHALSNSGCSVSIFTLFGESDMPSISCPIWNDDKFKCPMSRVVGSAIRAGVALALFGVEWNGENE